MRARQVRLGPLGLSWVLLVVGLWSAVAAADPPRDGAAQPAASGATTAASTGAAPPVVVYWTTRLQQNDVLGSGWVPGVGPDSLLLARAGVLHVFSALGAGFRDERTAPLPPGVAALGATPNTGDTPAQLLVGLTGAGGVGVYAWQDGELVNVGQTPYTWAPVAQVLSTDLDGDGLADIVTLGRDGKVFVFRWSVAGYRQAWQSGSDDGSFERAQFVDATGDGRPELLLTGTDRVELLAWRDGGEQGGGMQVVWRTFPWGGTRLTAVCACGEKGAPVIYVTGSNDSLDAYAWSGGALVNVAHVTSPNVVSELIGVIAVGGRPVFLGSEQNALVGWQLSGGALRKAWQLDLAGPPARTRAVGERTLVLGYDGSLSVVGLTADQRLRIEGTPYALTLQDAPLFGDGGEPLLSLRDWSTLVDFGYRWDPASGRLIAGKDLTLLVATTDDSIAWVNGRRNALGQSLVVKGKRVYASLELMQLLAGGLSWDPARRVLSVGY